MTRVKYKYTQGLIKLGRARGSDYDLNNQAEVMHEGDSTFREGRQKMQTWNHIDKA